MIVKCCSCNKTLGYKSMLTVKYWFKVSHGFCNECFSRQIFSIKGYTFKWLTYGGWKHE